jgi:hypothetical protein
VPTAGCKNNQVNPASQDAGSGGFAFLSVLLSPAAQILLDRFHLRSDECECKETTTMKTTQKQQKQPKVAWASIKNGTGEITGYIEVFWGGKLRYVTIPGASRFRATMQDEPVQVG